MRPHLLSAFLLLSLATGARAAAEAPFQLVKKLPIGGEGGWDYLTLDPESRRLFIARSTHVIVVDVDGYSIVGDIQGVDGVHGVALAPDLKRGFASSGRSNSVLMFDLATLKAVRTISPTGARPDCVLYDPITRGVFTFNGGSKDATAIDAANGSVVDTIPLDGKPEFAVSDGQGSVYVNLEDKGELVQLDSLRLSVKARWPLPRCKEPTGLSMDVEHRRLFSGCSNKKLVVVDADKGSVVAVKPIGEHVDATAFDPGAGLVFSSNGDGTLTVIVQKTPDKYAVEENVATERGARTMAIDPKTHRVFLATADLGPAPEPTADNPHPRPTVLPGTFRLLVYAR